MEVTSQARHQSSGILDPSEYPVAKLPCETPDGGLVYALVNTKHLPKIYAISTAWRAYWHPGAQTYYVCKWVAGKRFYLHRVVTDAPHGLVVDHRDRNGLHNCDVNLRVVPQGENVRNARTRPNKYARGVSWYARGNSWRARVKVGGKEIHLGYFAEKDQAAKAVREFLLSSGIQQQFLGGSACTD